MSPYFSITKLLDIYQLSSSAYYRYKININSNNKDINEPSKKEKKKNLIKEEILTIRKEFPDYGPHKIFEELKRKSITNNYGIVYQCYKELNLYILPEKTRKKANFKRTHKNKTDKLEPFPNLIKGIRFNVPFKALATDGVLIKYKTSGLHYAFIIDLYSRFIICYKYSANENSELYNNLLNKLGKALVIKPVESIFHTDQGSVFLSKSFNKHLESLGFVQSTSAKGTPTDNSLIENFHGILKRQIKANGIQLNKSQLTKLIDSFVYYYNYKRKSEKEGNTPFEKIKIYFKKQYSHLNVDKAQNLDELLKIVKENT